MAVLSIFDTCWNENVVASLLPLYLETFKYFNIDVAQTVLPESYYAIKHEVFFVNNYTNIFLFNDRVLLSYE